MNNALGDLRFRRIKFLKRVKSELSGRNAMQTNERSFSSLSEGYVLRRAAIPKGAAEVYSGGPESMLSQALSAQADASRRHIKNLEAVLRRLALAPKGPLAKRSSVSSRNQGSAEGDRSRWRGSGRRTDCLCPGGAALRHCALRHSSRVGAQRRSRAGRQFAASTPGWNQAG